MVLVGERAARWAGEVTRWAWARRLELAPILAGWLVLWQAITWDRTVIVSAVLGVNMLGLSAWALVADQQRIRQRTGTLGWALGLVLTADLVVSSTSGSYTAGAVIVLVVATGLVTAWWALESPIDQTARGYRRRLRRQRNIRAAQDALDRACWATRSTDLADPPIVRSVRTDRWGETWSLALRPGATVAVLDSALRSLESAYRFPPMSMTAKVDRNDASKATLRIASSDPLAEAPGLGPWGDPDTLTPSARTPVPVGVDATGNNVTVDLTETHHVGFGVTRSGKTWWARQLTTWWALAADADTPLIISLKRSGDWAPLTAAGVPVIFDLTDACRVIIEARKAMEARFVELETAGVSTVKADTRWNYQPIVIDEVHLIWLAGPDLVAKDLLQEAQAALTLIASQGLAAGYVLALFSQRSNVDFLPTAVSANTASRWVGRMATDRGGRDALGTPSDCRPETISEAHRGRAFVTGDTAPREVRTWGVDDVTIARHLRHQTTTTGAAPVDPGNDTDRAVIAALAAADQSPSQLAHATGLALSTITRALDRLAAEGLAVDLTPNRTRNKRWTVPDNTRSNTQP